MKTEIISSATDRAPALSCASAVLAQGGLVAIPTETVYGLAADAGNAAAIARIYETKGRPRFNPLICHMADLEMAERHGVLDPVARALAQEFWPGPLTIVAPLRPESDIHALATAGLDSVAMRVPKGFARELIAAYGRPLAAPSANISGRVSPTTARHVAEDLDGRIALIVDGGPAEVGLESTILRVEGDHIRLLRPGGIPAEDIEAATGLAVVAPVGAAPAIEAPGMLASHYAPTAPVRLMAQRVEAHEVLIRFGDAAVEGEDGAKAVIELSRAGDLAEAAANLFGSLKRADALAPSAIAVTPVPQRGLGAAINDRLARSAAPRL